MSYNYEMLRKVYDQVTIHPETHDQEVFICDTRRCIAGWTIEFSTEWEFDTVATVKPVGMSTVEALDLGEVESVSAAAKEILGLTDDEADYLFFCESNDEAIRYLEKLIATERTVDNE
jgi:hypothetical protein